MKSPLYEFENGRRSMKSHMKCTSMKLRWFMKVDQLTVSVTVSGAVCKSDSPKLKAVGCTVQSVTFLFQLANRLLGAVLV